MAHPKLPPEEVQRRRNVALSDRLLAIAREIGKGNASEGIRRALEAYQRDKR